MLSKNLKIALEKREKQGKNACVSAKNNRILPENGAKAPCLHLKTPAAPPENRLFDHDFLYSRRQS